MQRCQSGLMCTLGKRVWSKATSGSNPDLCAIQKNRAEEALSVRKLKISSIFLFKAPDENAKAFCAYSLAKKAAASHMRLKIICELRRRFLFESLKSARFFCLKRQTKMPKAFCAYSRAKKAAASHEVEDYMRAEEALSV